MYKQRKRNIELIYSLFREEQFQIEKSGGRFLKQPPDRFIYSYLLCSNLTETPS